PTSTLLLQPKWQDEALSDQQEDRNYAAHWILVCESEMEFGETLIQALPAAKPISIRSSARAWDARFNDYAQQVFVQIQQILQTKLTAPVLVQLVIVRSENENQGVLWAALSGLLKSANQENPYLVCQLLEVEAATSPERWVEQLKANRQSPRDHIRYHSDVRQVLNWRVGD